MANKGFRDSVESRISQLKDNLNDRYYQGFPVVKELVANADDAKATVVHLGWSPSPPGAAHPLLSRPGVFVVNDGTFREVDEQGIRQLGLGSRGADQTTIGRFGLGLKSVFHYCDALFYLASGRDGLEPSPVFDVLNPWSDEASGLHPDWDAIHAADAELLRELLAPCCQTRNWFALWLPLRCASDPKPFIMQEFRGQLAAPPTELLGDGVVARVASLLPLLSHVRSVRFWIGGERPEHTVRVRASCEVTSGSSRRRSLSELERQDSHSAFAGSIQVAVDQAHAWTSSYSAAEVMLRDPECDDLRSHRKWPHRHAVDPRSFDLVEHPEKAPPHAAVHILRTPRPAGHGELRVSWASYLPVGEPEERDRQPLGIQCDFDIVFHGVFFVDAGRRLVEFERPETIENERSVRLTWNRLLRDRGALPLLIPSLERAAAEGVVGHDEVGALTRALTRASTLRDTAVVDAVCATRQWVAVVTPDGERWVALDARETVFSLPVLGTLEETVDAIPTLKRLCREIRLCPEGSARIVARPPALAWPAHALNTLFECGSDLPEVGKAALESRSSFLHAVSPQGFPSEVIPAAQAYLRALLTRRRLAELADAPRAVSLLCERLPGARVLPLPIPCRAKGAATILAATNAAGAEHDIVVVPSELVDNDFDGVRVLPLRLATALLHRLAQCDGTAKQQPQFARVAAHIMSLCSEREALVGACGSLELFRDERSEADRVWSAQDIRSLHGQDRAACRRDDTERQLQQSLTAALSSEVCLVHADVAAAVLGPGVPVCSAQWVVRLLLGNPRLVESAVARSKLLALILPASDPTIPEHRRALRYLLHGQAGPDAERAVLFEPRSDAGPDLWDRLAASAMEQLGERWRLLSPELVAVLPGRARRQLGVECVDADGVGRLLEQVGVDAIDWSRLNARERETLATELEADGLVRRLPIHEAVDGRLVPLDERTYLESSWVRRVPRLAELVTLVRPAQSSRARARIVQLIPELDAEAVLRLALAAKDPSVHWAGLLEALGDLIHHERHTDELIAQLRETPWLPMTDGHVIAPEHLVHLPHEAAGVALGLVVDRCPLRAVEALQPDVQKHTSFPECRDVLLPSINEQLTQLVSYLDRQRASIGDLRFNSTEELDRWLAAFAGADGPDVMPVAAFLARLKSQEHKRLAVELIIPSLRSQLPDDRLDVVLHRLAKSLQSSASEQLDLRQMFLAYLKMVRAAQNPRAILRALRLPSRRGTWTSATSLSADAMGISQAHILDQDCLDALGDVVSRTQGGCGAQRPDEPPRDDGQLEAAVGESVKRLQDYFEPLTRIGDERLVGALLGLMGDQPLLAAFRTRYLDATRLEVFRSSLDWREQQGSTVVGSSESLSVMMRKQRFIVDVSADNAVRVVSIVGDEFDAPVSDVATTLLLGDRAPRFVGSYREGDGGKRVYRLRLRRLDPDSYGRFQWNDILCETARSLLSDVYCRSIPNFEQKWDSLVQSDQVDLEFTRGWLLRQAPIYLEQLGLRTDELLGPLLRDLKAAEREKHLEEHEGVPHSRRRGAAREDALRNQLESLLQSDAAVADRIRAKVRDKLSTKDEYTPDSVAFELFQNADDAATELRECHRPPRVASSEEQRFTARETPDGVMFLHRGRCINQHQLGEADCADRGFGQDLEKMLVLQSSDKQQGTGHVPVTGKFGLGFKSTFLVCDEPRLWSGRLRCRIHGAFLPIRDEQPCESVDPFFVAAHDTWPATAVVLTLRQGAETHDILARFRALAPLQSVFARSLSSIEIHTGSQSLQSRWVPTRLPGCVGVEIGLPHGAASALPAGTRACVVRADAADDSRAGALFLLGRRGFLPVPNGVPSLWATTPTRECLGFGVVINGPFSVHTGRARLADHPEVNGAVADALGAGAGAAFSSLVDLCCSDWPSARSALGLDEDVQAEGLWSSLWDLVETAVTELSRAAGTRAGEVAARVLWSSESGVLSGVVERYPVVPTRLPDPFAPFVAGRHVRTVIDERLVAMPEVLGKVMCLPSAQGLQDGAAVSARVWRTLETLDAHRKVTIVSLASALRLETEQDHRFDPARARLLSFVGRPEVVRALDAEAGDSLRSILDRVEFLSAAGEFELAERLLTPPSGSQDAERRDERLRAAFAPPSRVLAAEYGPDALAFFLLCRRQLRAPAEEVAAWASQAASAQARGAVLAYLHGGELRMGVIEALKRSYHDCWVFSLSRHSEELTGIPDDTALSLLASLGVVTWDSLGGDSGPMPPAPPREPVDPTAVLSAIESWWMREQTTRLREFERETFPGSVDLSALAAWDPHDVRARCAWLVVLLLGSFHTMGRTHASQHRAFMEHCVRGGWLQRFASQPEDARTWVDFLERYFASHTQDTPFLQWMLQLPRVYVLSRWLPEYAEAFLSINRPGAMAEPLEILAPAASQRFQGGGVIAPPLGRVLGLGYCFVLRELRRRGVLSRNDIDRDCYVPLRRVRELMSSLGAELDAEHGSVSASRAIHRCLVEHLGEERAVFSGAFDIPLLVVASDPSLLSQLTDGAVELAGDDNGEE